MSESYSALAVRLSNTRVASAETCEQAAGAIVVLLAERQQAIDALREAHEALGPGEAELAAAEAWGITARALVKLGEKP